MGLIAVPSARILWQHGNLTLFGGRPPESCQVLDMQQVEVTPIFSGGGEMGALMRTFDWAATPLDTPDHWPQSLRSALSICLGSRYPIGIYWGPELVLLYKDAWRPILGNKHRWALGRPAREVWPEVWDTIGPLFEHVLTTGEATWSEDQLLPINRHGYTEECYFNYTFSPIRGQGGAVDGIFNAVIETTYRVIGERRTHLLHELADCTSTVRTAEEACLLAAETLGQEPCDVPFCLLYLLKSEGGEPHAQLAASAGLAAHVPAALALVACDDARDAHAPLLLARVA